MYFVLIVVGHNIYDGRGLSYSTQRRNYGTQRRRNPTRYICSLHCANVLLIGTVVHILWTRYRYKAPGTFVLVPAAFLLLIYLTNKSHTKLRYCYPIVNPSTLSPKMWLQFCIFSQKPVFMRGILILLILILIVLTLLVVLIFSS